MYDYHTHTSFSDDSSTPMADMIAAACEAGLKEIAITDHFDPDYPDKAYPFELDFENYHKALIDAIEANKARLTIRKGVEIGIQHGSTMKRCSECAHSFDYDFIIGSFHCAEGYELYGNGYFSGRTPEESYIAYYTYVLENLKKYKDYDVIGHLNIIDRYTDKMADPASYMDIVAEIIKLIIADGKGLEINTSSFRYGLGDRTTPAQEMLQLYKDYGGEIMTIGSDAHRPKDIGFKLDYAQQMMRDLGFRYLTTFEQRKPIFKKL